MNSKEKAEMLAGLESGQQAIIGVLSGVTEDVARRSPGNGRWSVLECIEHVALGEAYFLAQLEGATLSEAPLVNSAREKAIVERGADRTTRYEAPDVARPTGRFATLKDATDHFTASRARTLNFVESCSDDLRARLAHHPVIGVVNSHEVLLLMTAHSLRHTHQIREILDAVNPPAQ
jgi:hypothetical protein